MLSAQCGCLLSCLVITLLQQRTQATATTSTTTTTASTAHEHRQSHQQNHSQKQQKTMDNHTRETEADTETGVTCYTCVNVSDNLVCNRFAIDRPCPQGEDFCHTLHIMDSRGESVVVNKKCADQTECSPQRVGCLSIDTQTVCVSCCDEMYCNISVPSNQSTAVYSDRRTKAKRRSQHHNSSNSTNTASRRHWLPPSSLQTPTHLLVVLLAMVASLIRI